MRNMSFALTTQQILARTKFVTRRNGWEFLKVGDLVQPVKKGMGLKPGEKIERLGAPIKVVSVRREKLGLMIDSIDYGFVECDLEGFPDGQYSYPSTFVEMFCGSHKGCTPDSIVTRIEFEYTSGKPNSEQP